MYFVASRVVSALLCCIVLHPQGDCNTTQHEQPNAVATLQHDGSKRPTFIFNSEESCVAFCVVIMQRSIYATTILRELL